MPELLKWGVVGLWSAFALGAAAKGLDFAVKRKRDNPARDEEIKPEDR